MSAARTLGSGRYRLDRPLGGGAYLAHDLELDRAVAVTLLAPGERLQREARLAAAVAHPNVVRVFDAGEDEGARWVVTEHVEGESLAELLGRRGRLPPGEAARLGLQAAEGLGAAHRAGLVHGDVSPRSLLVAADGTLKVTGVGAARAAEPGPDAGAYAAPEAARGGELAPAADVHSLAAVVYEALTGRPPQAHPAGGIVPPRDLEPSVPPEIEAVLMRALARDPAHRPADGGELARALDAATATEPLPPAASAVPTASSSNSLSRGSWHRRRGLSVRTPVRGAASNRLLLGSTRGMVLVALVAAALVAGGVAGALALARGGGGSATRKPAAVPVRPVPTASRPEAQARSLAQWIREHSR